MIGLFESAANHFAGNGMTTWQWPDSRLTPELRFIFANNAMTTFSSVVALMHLSVDFLDND